eukprot:92295-Alexandrium_andersonii.AAC.1
MGGILQDTSGFVSYWFDILRREDLARLDAHTGGPEFNTLWEALAVSVGLRAWRTLFTRKTPVLPRSSGLMQRGSRS